MLRKPDSDERDLLRAVWGGEPDGWRRWRRNYDLETCPTRFHGLFPLLARRLPEDVLGAADGRILRGIYRYHWTRNQLFKARVVEALECLAQASLEALLLDDLALAMQAYLDLGARPLQHSALLVHPHDRERAVAVLEEVGWEADRPLGVVSCNLRDRGDQRRCLSLLSSASDGWWRGEEDWWALAQRDRECPRLAPEDALQRLILNAYQGETPLLWISDACALLQSHPDFDWSRCLHSSQRRRIALLMRSSLLEVGEWVTLPHQVRAWMRTFTPSVAERLYALALQERVPCWSRWFQDYLNFLTWTTPHEAAGARSLGRFLRHRWRLDGDSPLARLRTLGRRLRSRLGRLWRGIFAT